MKKRVGYITNWNLKKKKLDIKKKFRIFYKFKSQKNSRKASI